MNLQIWAPSLLTRAQMFLGLVFIASAWAKITDPPEFAKAVWNYQLLPFWMVNPTALVLPWLELLVGIALCLGVWVRGAVAWVVALLLAFMLALSINLGRNHPVDCGCFKLGSPVMTEAERLMDMRWSIFRDLGLLLIAVYILRGSVKTGLQE